MVKTYTRVILALLLVVSSLTCHAQNALSREGTTTVVDTTLTTRKFPSCILVQLRSERNRINALAKDRRLLNQLKADAAAVTTKMIADFHDNLTFCPVYYYMDSNIDLVKKHAFKGILFNADSTPVLQPVISDTSQDYLIVYYGYPATQSRIADSATNDTIKKYAYGDPSNPPKQSLMTDSMITDMEKYSDYGDPMGKGFVINNCRFKQVSFFFKFGYDDVFFKFRRSNRKYIYNSKRFDIEYYPMAEELNVKLYAGAKKVPITYYVGSPDFWQIILGKSIRE